MNHVTHPLSFVDISVFSPEISKFCYIKIYRLTDIQSLKIVLINMITMLMMSAKMATPDLRKIKIF